jgi:hypothetical protein
LASHNSLLSQASRTQRAFSVHLHKCIQLRIEAVDLVQMRFENLNRGDTSLAYEFSDLSGGERS